MLVPKNYKTFHGSLDVRLRSSSFVFMNRKPKKSMFPVRCHDISQQCNQQLTMISYLSLSKSKSAFYASSNPRVIGGPLLHRIRAGQKANETAWPQVYEALRKLGGDGAFSRKGPTDQH